MCIRTVLPWQGNGAQGAAFEWKRERVLLFIKRLRGGEGGVPRISWPGARERGGGSRVLVVARPLVVGDGLQDSLKVLLQVAAGTKISAT